MKVTTLRNIDFKNDVFICPIQEGICISEFELEFENDIQILDKEPEMAAKLDAKSTIELAKLRVQIKKLEKQLSVREDTKKRLLLDDLTQQLHQLQGA